MFAEAIPSIEKALFAIVRMTPNMPAPGKVTAAVTGCGFFIDDHGTFVSVAHAFDAPSPTSKFVYFGRLPNEFTTPGLEISEVGRENEADIYIGKVALETPDFLPLAAEIVPNGRSVCASGYSLPKLAVNLAGGFDFGGVKRRYRSSMVIDRVTCNVENGRTQTGVLLQDEALFGMSGGPVVDSTGLCVGMMGSVTTPQESIGGDGERKIIVENGVVITSDQIKTLYDRLLGLRTVLPVDLEALTIAIREAKRTA